MLAEKLRRAARFARHWPDRRLHRRRRRSALRRLSLLPPPKTLLFICNGNICRSPFAAAVARTLVPAGTVVTSAGFIGPDRPAPDQARAVAREFGVDLTPHRSQLVSAALLDAADLVFVMDGAQRRLVLKARRDLGARAVLLGDLDPEPIAKRAIPDPVDRPLDVFRSAYARVARCTRALATLWQERPAE